jgi:DNA-binding transcriptional MerR regulator
MSNLSFTIGEVANLLGISPKTVLHYHKIGLLAHPERTANNYRHYNMAQITQLQQILRLKRFGLSLKQIEIILNSDNPDMLVQIVLNQHISHLHDEIARLQHQLNITQDFLNTTGTSAQSHSSQNAPVSSMVILSDAIKRRSSSVSDILVEVEQKIMVELDQFAWDANYELFWHHIGNHFIESLADEGLFIFWMERYLALATMDIDDLQGNAWLQELNYSPARQILSQAFILPNLAILPEKDQQQIIKLLLALLYQQGTPLQRHFLGLLIKR